MQKTYTKADSDERVHSSGIGVVYTRFKNLLATFGEPHMQGSPDSKVRAEWAFKVEEKDAAGETLNLVVTIYDYKDEDKLEEVADWHIGGKGDSKKIIEWVCFQLGLDPKIDAYIHHD